MSKISKALMMDFTNNGKYDSYLLCEFMGYVPIKYGEGSYGWSRGPYYSNHQVTYDDCMEGIVNYMDRVFMYDIGLLMMVVEKIEGIKGEGGVCMFNFKIEQVFVEVIDNRSSDTIVEVDGVSKVAAVRDGCIEFVKWWNKRK